MTPRVPAAVVEAASCSTPSVRELLDRLDADETFARIARALGETADEMIVCLTALAVLRARAASERRMVRR